MRLYSVVNSNWIKPLQCGLQTAHAVGNISVKYSRGSDQYPIYEEWATNHKTIIILNGGNNAGIRKAYDIFSVTGLPFTAVHEDYDSLDGALTSASIIVPSYIYASETMHIMPTAIELREYLQSLRLA